MLAPRLEGGHQHRLHIVLANALSQARQAQRVNGRLDLQIGLTGEELPIRVLDPKC